MPFGIAATATAAYRAGIYRDTEGWFALRAPSRIPGAGRNKGITVSAELIQEALIALGAADRLLLAMPATDPDFQAVRLAVVDLQTAYRRLSAPAELPSANLGECRRLVDGSRQTLAGVRSRRK